MTDLSRRGALIGGAAIGTLGATHLSRAMADVVSQPILPIPQELRANTHREIVLSARAGTVRLLGGQQTATYGYNGPFLGPALRLRRGQTVLIDFTNQLPHPTTVHWHGLIIPGDVDGGP